MQGAVRDSSSDMLPQSFLHIAPLNAVLCWSGSVTSSSLSLFVGVLVLFYIYSFYRRELFI